MGVFHQFNLFFFFLKRKYLFEVLSRMILECFRKSFFMWLSDFFFFIHQYATELRSAYAGTAKPLGVSNPHFLIPSFRSMLPPTLGLHLRRTYVTWTKLSFASFGCHDDPVVSVPILTPVLPPLNIELKTPFWWVVTQCSSGPERYWQACCM